ncbi:uncharacterized protein VTP21DRAFT_121 [Calcarisporiella thermophila]|uniref:uncharacterized protein n=1 Tax=Calcarisporiella thermophila TaxID=911321 RepID=UPI003743DC3A
MKFSHALKINSVPDWSEHYVAYSNLKKIIYQLEKDVHNQALAHTDEERQALIAGSESHVNALFVRALDVELQKCVNFYIKKEKELYVQLEALIMDVEYIEAQGEALGRRQSMAASNSLGERGGFARSQSQGLSSSLGSEEHIDDTLSLQPKSGKIRRSSAGGVRINLPSGYGLETSTASQAVDIPPRVRYTEDSDSENAHTPPGELSFYGRNLWDDYERYQQRLTFKHRIVDLFVLLSELKSFVNLNLQAFSKILKKFDKITGSKLKSVYLEQSVNVAYPFRAETKDRLNGQVQRLEQLYARICTDNDVDQAIRELKTHLREHIVMERNTVWRDMISLERRSQALTPQDPLSAGAATTKLVTPMGMVSVPTRYLRQVLLLIACTAVFSVLLYVPIFKKVEENNCFALLVFASILWATEVIPLFVTSLLIPFLVVILRVMRDVDGKHHYRLDAPEATRRIFGAMFSPVIMLLLGGFAIAAALSKHHLAKMLATFVLSKAGTRPGSVLFATMLVATFLSMWISNVAAPVLCFSIIQPILRTLPPNSSFAKCLILGIALASNVGGMASPISSPQNIVAIANMNPPPGWLEWFFVSIPLCITTNLLIWMLLLWSYRISASTSVHTVRPTQDPINRTQVFVIMVTILTIFLWCIARRLAPVFGDMGVIAVVPLVCFFGTGVLTKEDFNNFLWTVIILAMGGIALGKAVDSSGLLHTIAGGISGFVGGYGSFAVLSIFGALVLVVATFISHTVAALIVLPIVAEVGTRMPDPHGRLLVMGTALVCSAAMGLPVSGFPNMNAIMLENEMGKAYLSTRDFLRTGVPASVLATALVVTMGYGLMELLGF